MPPVNRRKRKVTLVKELQGILWLTTDDRIFKVLLTFIINNYFENSLVHIQDDCKNNVLNNITNNSFGYIMHVEKANDYKIDATKIARSRVEIQYSIYDPDINNSKLVKKPIITIGFTLNTEFDTFSSYAKYHIYENVLNPYCNEKTYNINLSELIIYMRKSIELLQSQDNTEQILNLL